MRSLSGRQPISSDVRDGNNSNDLHTAENKTSMCSLRKNKSQLNHLLYMDDLKLHAKSHSERESLLHALRIFSNDIGMEFGLDKCVTIKMTRGKQVEMEKKGTLMISRGKGNVSFDSGCSVQIPWYFRNG